MNVSIGGFRALSRRLVALSERVCEGRMVAVLEGGYELTGLGQSVTALLDEMATKEPSKDEVLNLPVDVQPGALRAIEASAAALASARSDA